MWWKFGKIVLISVLSYAFAFGGLACDTGAPANENNLPPVEVREYQGEDLSSIYDFRENAIKGPQHVDIDSYKLEIMGLVSYPLTLTYDQALEGRDIYKKIVTLDCVEGWSATILWEGPLVEDFLNEAGILPEAKVVIFHAYDGYTTSVPLDYILDNDILLASKMNDATIIPERGYPFTLVAESKWGYKWIKWVTKIELSDDTDYRGYWEKRGYSNSADTDKSFFGD